MRKSIRFAAVLLSVALALSASACGKIIEKRDDTDKDVATSEYESDTTDADTADAAGSVETLTTPEFVSPLTGLGTTEELAQTRPVAVMINNIRDAMPQEGTSFADVIYECIVEGAQTRLMAVYLDYKSVPVIGSVRSSREYFLDFAANHDAIYVHAGGSNEAYKQIKSSKVNNLDGVNMYLPDTFYRDAERRKTMSLEHTLMTSGEGIADGIEFKGYRASADSDFDGPFNFVDFGDECIPDGEAVNYVSVTYSPEHSPYYIYNEDSKKYERYQFDEEQIDNQTGDTLAFDNIVILYMSTYNTGDSYGHYNVKATGEGSGVYITRGSSVEITWKKPDRATPVKLYTKDGEELLMNRGKTMMQICTDSMKETTVIGERTE